MIFNSVIPNQVPESQGVVPRLTREQQHELNRTKAELDVTKCTLDATRQQVSCKHIGMNK